MRSFICLHFPYPLRLLLSFFFYFFSSRPQYFRNPTFGTYLRIMLLIFNLSLRCSLCGISLELLSFPFSPSSHSVPLTLEPLKLRPCLVSLPLPSPSPPLGTLCVLCAQILSFMGSSKISDPSIFPFPPSSVDVPPPCESFFFSSFSSSEAGLFF